MRKCLGFLFAVALCVPVGVITAGSAGSATNTKLPTCKAFSGKSSYKPGLAKPGGKAVIQTQTASGKFTKCSGGGITSGTTSGTTKAKEPSSCDTLIADTAAGKPNKPFNSTVTWSNGQKTVSSVVLKVTKLNANGTLNGTLTSTIKSGLGKGHKTIITILATPNKGWCSTAPLKSATFKATKIQNK